MDLNSLEGGDEAALNLPLLPSAELANGRSDTLHRQREGVPEEKLGDGNDLTPADKAEEGAREKASLERAKILAVRTKNALLVLLFCVSTGMQVCTQCSGWSERFLVPVRML